MHTDQEGCSDRERAKLKAIVEDRMVKKVTDQNKRADSSVGQNVSKVGQCWAERLQGRAVLGRTSPR